jgi:hypothetical protein
LYIVWLCFCVFCCFGTRDTSWDFMVQNAGLRVHPQVRVRVTRRRQGSPRDLPGLQEISNATTPPRSKKSDGDRRWPNPGIWHAEYRVLWISSDLKWISGEYLTIDTVDTMDAIVNCRFCRFCSVISVICRFCQRSAGLKELLSYQIVTYSV